MIGKRSPGDRFIPSQDWNTLADMANRGMIGTQDRERTTNGNQSVIIKVRNDTGDTLARRSIVGLGGSAIDYAAYPAQWKRDIAIIAEVPEVGTHDKKWAIIQDSIPDGGYGEAVLYGVSQCTVYVNDDSHGYASIADGETGYLTSGASGTAIILWKESGTGSKLALVQHVVPSASATDKVGTIHLAKEFLISDGNVDTTLDYSEICALGRPKITADIDLLGGDVTVKYNANPYGGSPQKTFVINTAGVYEFEVFVQLTTSNRLSGGIVSLAAYPASRGNEMGCHTITDHASDTDFDILGKITARFFATEEIAFGLYNPTGVKLVYNSASYTGPQVKITKHDHVSDAVYFGDLLVT